MTIVLVCSVYKPGISLSGAIAAESWTVASAFLPLKGLAHEDDKARSWSRISKAV